MIVNTLKPFSFIIAITALVSLACINVSCTSSSSSDTPINNDPPAAVEKIDEDQFMDDTFRIDIKHIEVSYDIYPDTGTVTGHAEVTFTMRNNQVTPVIHFDPWSYSGSVQNASLNGESLNPTSTDDIRMISFESSSQQAVEIQRTLVANTTHIFTADFTLNNAIANNGFYTHVHDVNGDGNEEIFPTLNTPQELATHIISFKVHSDKPYRCIGSGLVEPDDTEDGNAWVLKTEREVASYTIMFLLFPEEDTIYEEREINGVEVRIMAYNGYQFISNAFDHLESWLPELESNLGPLPMNRGLSIFMTFSGGGMEYFGGTITSLEALNHEIFHMYYGCSTVAKTYRDSWWDEAINMWYEYSALYSNYAPISESYRSGIVRNRTPISVGLDSRAYNEGARIIEAVAREMGGRGEMIDFLKYVHQNYSFAPFNTLDFVQYIKDYSGVDMKERFLNWLYYGDNIYYKDTPSVYDWLHSVDMNRYPVKK